MWHQENCPRNKIWLLIRTLHNFKVVSVWFPFITCKYPKWPFFLAGAFCLMFMQFVSVANQNEPIIILPFLFFIQTWECFLQNYTASVYMKGFISMSCYFSMCDFHIVCRDFQPKLSCYMEILLTCFLPVDGYKRIAIMKINHQNLQCINFC